MTAITAAYLTQQGDSRIGTLTLLNTMLDYANPGEKPDCRWRIKAERERMLTRVAQDAQRALIAIEHTEGLLDDERVADAHRLLRELIGGRVKLVGLCQAAGPRRWSRRGSAQGERARSRRAADRRGRRRRPDQSARLVTLRCWFTRSSSGSAFEPALQCSSSGIRIFHIDFIVILTHESNMDRGPWRMRRSA